MLHKKNGGIQLEFLDFMLKGNYKKFYQSLKEISKKNGKNPSLMFVDAAFSSILYGSRIIRLSKLQIL